MSNANFTEVSQEQYMAFLKSYPAPLDFDCAGIVEPPLESYNDFSSGKVWPESIVAKASREWLGPNGEVDHSVPGRFWKYYIRNESKE